MYASRTTTALVIVVLYDLLRFMIPYSNSKPLLTFSDMTQLIQVESYILF